MNKYLCLLTGLFLCISGSVVAQDIIVNSKGSVICYFAHTDSTLKAESHQAFGNLDYEDASVNVSLNLNTLVCNDKRIANLIHSQEDSIAIFKGSLNTTYINPKIQEPQTFRLSGAIEYIGEKVFAEGQATLSHISNDFYYYGILSFRLHVKLADLGLESLYPNTSEFVYLEITLGVTTNK